MQVQTVVLKKNIYTYIFFKTTVCTCKLLKKLTLSKQNIKIRVTFDASLLKVPQYQFCKTFVPWFRFSDVFFEELLSEDVNFAAREHHFGLHLVDLPHFVFPNPCSRCGQHCCIDSPNCIFTKIRFWYL